MEFGARIRSMRKQRGLTQEEVASAAGISRRAYARYEGNNVRPRSQETYEKLADVLGCDVNDLLVSDDAFDELVSSLKRVSGVKAAAYGVGAAAAAMTPIVGHTLGALAATLAVLQSGDAHDRGLAAPITHANDMLLQNEKIQKQFAAMATGLIYSQLAAKCIAYQPVHGWGQDPIGCNPDVVIALTKVHPKEWWLTFCAKDPVLDKHAIVTPNDRAEMLFGRFASCRPDRTRKISIVVDDEALFEALLRLRGHNSLRANLSAILIDGDGVLIAREEYLAHYLETESDCFTIV